MIYKNACVYGKICDIEIRDTKIINVGTLNENGVDLMGAKVFPGLIDIHTHGCVGGDTMDGKYLCKMSEYMLQNGVTSWLPTTMTMDMETIKGVVNITLPKTNGAQILGFHMEGPYINVKYKGAQNEKYIKAPELEEFESLDNMLMVTVAPEASGSMDFIEKCKAVVCIGHTDSDYECAIEAI